MAPKNTNTFVRELLITTLKKLSPAEFEEFKYELCKTPMNKLVRAGDEYHDEPNVFGWLDTIEAIVDKLISKFNRTHSLIAAETVLEKIGRWDLSQELQGKAKGLAATHHGLKRERQIIKGLFKVATGAVIGTASLGAAGVAVAGAPLAMAVGGVCLGGVLVIKGMRHIF